MMRKCIIHLGTGIYSTSWVPLYRVFGKTLPLLFFWILCVLLPYLPTEAAYRLTLDHWLKWLGITAFVITSSPKQNLEVISVFISIYIKLHVVERRRESQGASGQRGVPREGETLQP